jgi:N-methylhydantoinase A
VCYGRGGTRATLTDANLLLGYLNADNFLGGELRLDRDGAERALEEVGRSVGMSAVDTALAARHIVEAQMADLIRQMTVERGMDTRDFSLYAYGGAAGLHVAGYLRELGAPSGVIPLGTLSTTWSAYGCATSDVIHVHERAVHLASPFDAEALETVLRELEDAARAELSEEGIPAGNHAVERFVEMKYPLQIHRVEVPLVDPHVDAQVAEALGRRFAARYDELYGKGSAFEAAGSEIVGCRVLGRGQLPQPEARAAEEGASAEVAERVVIWASAQGAQELATTIVPAGRVGSGDTATVTGPAVVEATTTTVVVPPGATATADADGNLVLSAGEPVAGAATAAAAAAHA